MREPHDSLHQRQRATSRGSVGALAAAREGASRRSYTGFNNHVCGRGGSKSAASSQPNFSACFLRWEATLFAGGPLRSSAPFVWEPQSQSACKIDELVHEGLLWVTVRARGGGWGDGSDQSLCVRWHSWTHTGHPLAFSAHIGRFLPQGKVTVVFSEILAQKPR